MKTSPIKTKVTYWASSPLITAHGTPPGARTHSLLMSVKQGRKAEKTVLIATCINAAVSKRLAEALNKFEHDLK